MAAGYVRGICERGEAAGTVIATRVHARLVIRRGWAATWPELIHRFLQIVTI